MTTVAPDNHGCGASGVERESASDLALIFCLSTANWSMSFFISVAALDNQGHESLFAYPEVRCDSAGCGAPASALSATRPESPSAAKDVEDEK